MRLFGSPTSPYVRKVRVLAAELALPLELELVDIHSLDQSFESLNPVNRIPALELDSGNVLFDSRVISEFLNHLAGGDWLPPAGEARWRVLKVQAMADGVMDAAAPCSLELARPASRQLPQRIRQYRRSIVQTLDALENASGQLGDHDLGVIAVGCALGYLDLRQPVDDWRRNRPRLTRWYGGFSSRQSMIDTFPHRQPA